MLKPKMKNKTGNDKTKVLELKILTWASLVKPKPKTYKHINDMKDVLLGTF